METSVLPDIVRPVRIEVRVNTPRLRAVKMLQVIPDITITV